MNEKSKPEEIQSRREFFKKAAKATLPVLGAFVLSSLPLQQVEAQGCSTCTGGCFTGCKYSCDRSCETTCRFGCKTGCKSVCKGSCLGGCKGSVRFDH